MKLLLSRAKSFHKPDGGNAPDSIVTLPVGTVEAPEWIRNTNTYRAGVADGSIRDFAPTGSAVFVPSKEQLLERGYAPDVADEIIVRQRELANHFAPEAGEEEFKTETAPAPLMEPVDLGFGNSSESVLDPNAPKKTKAATKTAKK